MVNLTILCGVLRRDNNRKLNRTLLTFAILVSLICSLASARYLPTRSDDSKREHIKEVLKSLLEMSNSGSDEGFPANRLPYSYEYPGNQYPNILAKRSVRDEQQPNTAVVNQ